MKVKNMSQVTLAQVTEMLEVSSVIGSIDLGESIVHYANHPVLGEVIIVNTGGEKHALMELT